MPALVLILKTLSLSRAQIGRRNSHLSSTILTFIFAFSNWQLPDFFSEDCSVRRTNVRKYFPNAREHFVIAPIFVTDRSTTFNDALCSQVLIYFDKHSCSKTLEFQSFHFAPQEWLNDKLCHKSFHLLKYSTTKIEDFRQKKISVQSPSLASFSFSSASWKKIRTQ